MTSPNCFENSIFTAFSHSHNEVVMIILGKCLVGIHNQSLNQTRVVKYDFWSGPSFSYSSKKRRKKNWQQIQFVGMLFFFC